jgi:uracil-DNA glycosylase
MKKLRTLLREVRSCDICSEHLPQGPRPVVSAHESARILIIGQAPGKRVHESGGPWDDPSGDRPPRPECADAWHEELLRRMPDVKLTLLLSQHAHARYLSHGRKASLTETVRAWREYWPRIIPLPHPSPRNNIWLKKNPWFVQDVLPYLRPRAKQALR